MAATADLAGSAGLADRLEALAPGSVRARAIDRLAMAHDASHYLITPLGVVTVRDREHLAGLVRLAAEAGVPLAFRSGGTSLSGQASTGGLMLDTRRSFRGIEVLDGGARVRVQPGATVRQVNARLARHGRKLGPDPASEAACTLGGVIANNSSGMSCGTEFNTYNTIESAVLVLPDGTIVDTAAENADERLREQAPDLHAGLLRLRDRVRSDPATVAEVRRQYAIKNTMGYGVNAFLDFDTAAELLLHLVVGSEGTLAFVAEATLRTLPVRPHIATGMLYFPTLAGATGALPALVASGLATVELLDATSLRVAQRDPGADAELLALEVDRHAALLVEYQEADAPALAARLSAWEPLARSLPLARPATLTSDAARRNALWHIRKDLYATVAGNRPSGTTALLEDIAVPVAALRETCEGLIGLFDRHGYEDSVIFGHAKDGNIHFMLTERFDDPDQLARYERFTAEMVELVLAHGGSLKAEHGTGRIMAPFVRRQFGDELYAVMHRVKQLCDPHGILNPGVVLSDDPGSYLRDLKLVPSVEAEVDRCVECGYCEPVCPSRTLTLTPRQRIVLRREVEAARERHNDVLVQELLDDYDYDGTQTCAVDGMCGTACPVQINTGDLVRRLRREERSPLEQTAWDAVARSWGTVARAGGLAMDVAAALPDALPIAATRVGRALLGDETVPLYDGGLPGGGRARPRAVAVTPRTEFVYFSACITTMFGPATGSHGVSAALTALCERAGVAWSVPEGLGGMCCGTPWKSKGFSQGYDRMSDRVLPALLQASDGGRLPIVCDAASCTEGLLTMRQIAVAAGGPFAALWFVDAVQFVHDRVLPELRVRARVPSLTLHPTCSTAQLGIDPALRAIAHAAADEVHVPTDWGCCAFAGDRGLLHPELTAAATAAEAAEVRARGAAAHASANRTCEIGMTRATGSSYRHVLEVLEEATRPAGTAGNGR